MKLKSGLIREPDLNPMPGFLCLLECLNPQLSDLGFGGFAIDLGPLTIYPQAISLHA